MSLQDIYKKAGVVMKPAAMKDGKLYSQQPHSGAGDFNFSRADGVQTRINKHGLIETVANNEPRLSYDLVDGKVSDCPHLLLEPSRTNLVLESENFNNYFTKISSATITSNDIIAPDGSQSGDKLTKGTAPLCLRRSSQVSIGIQYAFSVYAKKGSVDKIQLDIGDAGIQEFTLTDEWQRFEVTATPPTFTHIDIEMPTGSSGDYIYLFGAQVEAGSYATSYIPTSGSTETRQADICNGSGNSETFNDSEGVLYTEIAALADDASLRLIQINDGSTVNNMVTLGYNSAFGQLLVQIRSGGGTINVFTHNITDVTLYNKLGLKYEQNTLTLYVNGFEAFSSSITATPIGLSELDFDYNGGFPFYGKVKELTVINEALTDEQLQLLTTP